MKRTLWLSTILATLLLSACGGGGGSDDGVAAGSQTGTGFSQGASAPPPTSPTPGSADPGAFSQPTVVRFSSPRLVAADEVGRVYVVDSGDRRVREIDSQGRVTTLFTADSPIRGIAARPQGDYLFLSIGNDIVRIATRPGSQQTQILPVSFHRRNTNAHTRLAYYNGSLYILVVSAVYQLGEDGQEHPVYATHLNYGLANITTGSGGLYVAENLIASSCSCSAVLQPGVRVDAARGYPVTVFGQFNQFVTDLVMAGGIPYALTGSTLIRGTDNAVLAATTAADMALGSDGNLYAVDPANHVVWRITREGRLSEFAGVAGQSD